MSTSISQTPYMIRALWQWCTDSGLSPQILVAVDQMTQVPNTFVVDGRIVLDISAEATNRLELGDEWISFQARFGNKVENLNIPVANVMAIFAEETNQGMMFDVDTVGFEGHSENEDAPSDEIITSSEAESNSATRSPLKIVK